MAVLGAARWCSADIRGRAPSLADVKRRAKCCSDENRTLGRERPGHGGHRAFADQRQKLAENGARPLAGEMSGHNLLLRTAYYGFRRRRSYVGRAAARHPCRAPGSVSADMRDGAGLRSSTTARTCVFPWLGEPQNSEVVPRGPRTLCARLAAEMTDHRRAWRVRTQTRTAGGYWRVLEHPRRSLVSPRARYPRPPEGPRPPQTGNSLAAETRRQRGPTARFPDAFHRPPRS